MLRALRDQINGNLARIEAIESASSGGWTAVSSGVHPHYPDEQHRHELKKGIVHETGNFSRGVRVRAPGSVDGARR
jgi:hypothetical protein